MMHENKGTRTENLNIQKAVSEDVDEIEAIYHESIAWLNGQSIHQWQEGVYPTRKSAQMALDDDSLYCCRINQKIVATFIINEIQPPQYQTLNWKYQGPAMVLHTLVVRPCDSGRGIGRLAVEYVIRQARKNKYHCVRLDAFPDNKAAVRLYLSLGFEYAGKVFFDIKEPSYEWYDCYEMKL